MEGDAWGMWASYLLHGAAVFCASLAIALALGTARTTKDKTRFLLAITFMAGIALVTLSFFLMVITARTGYFHGSKGGILEVAVETVAFVGSALFAGVSYQLWFKGVAR